MTALMLWYEPRGSLPAKLTAAADYYRRKYGQGADTCYVHTSAVDGEKVIDGIAIKQDQYVRPNYLLIGVEA